MRKLFLCLFFTACFLICAETGYACSCVEPSKFAKDPKAYVNHERDKAGAVFSGKVLRIDQMKDPKGKSTGVVRVRFAVDVSWKNVETSRVTVTTTNVCCICGYPFKVGEEYLVYASGSDLQSLRASICSRTKSLEDAAEDLIFLGEGKAISKVKRVNSHSKPQKTKS